MGKFFNLLTAIPGLQGLLGGGPTEEKAPANAAPSSQATAPRPETLEAHHVVSRSQAEALAQSQSTPTVAAQPAPVVAHGPVLEQIAKLLSTLAVPQDAISKIMNFITQFLPAATPAPVAAQNQDINGLLAAFEAVAKETSQPAAAQVPANDKSELDALVQQFAQAFGSAAPTEAKPAAPTPQAAASPTATTQPAQQAPADPMAGLARIFEQLAAATPPAAKSAA